MSRSQYSPPQAYPGQMMPPYRGPQQGFPGQAPDQIPQVPQQQQPAQQPQFQQPNPFGSPVPVQQGQPQTADVDPNDPLFAGLWEDDVVGQAEQQIQQGQQPAPAAFAPQQRPTAPGFVGTPSLTGAPDNSNALMRAEIQRTLAEMAANGQAPQGRGPGRPRKDTSQPAETPLFSPEDVQLTPEEEQAIGGAAGRAIFAKLMRRELSDYDSRRVAPQFQSVAERERQQQEYAANMARNQAAQLLSARVPDMEDILRDPAYQQYTAELVYDPSSPVPVPRGSLIGRAFETGNSEYVAHELQQFRQRFPRQNQQPMPQQQPQFQQPQAPQYGSPVAAPAQAPVAYPAAAPAGAAGSVYGGAAGQSVPPTMANIVGRPRRFRIAEAERSLLELGNRLRENPHDVEAATGYDKLYRLIRQERFGARRG